MTDISINFPGGNQNPNGRSAGTVDQENSGQDPDHEVTPEAPEVTASDSGEPENQESQQDPDPSDDERNSALSLSDRVRGLVSTTTKLAPKKKKKESVSYVDQDDEELSLLAMKVRRKREDIDLRRMIAKFTMWIVVIQIMASNVFMGWYLWFNYHQPNQAIMLGWMSSSVIEIVGIMAIVAGSLFPNKKVKSKASDSKTE